MLKQNRWGLVILLLLSAFLATLMITSGSYAQENSITPNDAAKHIGEVQTVCGMVASSKFSSQSKRQPTFINCNRSAPIEMRQNFLEFFEKNCPRGLVLL